MAKAPKNIKIKVGAPSPSAGKVPKKGGASVAQESGSRNAPIINIGIDRQDRAAIAEGLSRVLADTYTLKISTVPDVPQTPPKAMEMVRILVKGHETVSRIAREFIPVAEEAGDDPTADMLTARCTVHDQTAWMLRSLLED
ncbi:MAG: DNA starvation/stationary phase protection protein [Variovorax sp.]|nr:MAG: DNA starvation/stationary phase protection protein [Variovorax sp.]